MFQVPSNELREDVQIEGLGEVHKSPLHDVSSTSTDIIIEIISEVLKFVSLEVHLNTQEEGQSYCDSVVTKFHHNQHANNLPKTIEKQKFRKTIGFDFNTKFVVSDNIGCIPLFGIHVTSVSKQKNDCTLQVNYVKSPNVDSKNKVVHDIINLEKDVANDDCNRDSTRYFCSFVFYFYV